MSYDCVVFTGQGSQCLGMGRDWVQYPEAQAIFQQTTELLGFDLYDICQNDEARLNLTEYTQPALLMVEIALFRILQTYHVKSGSPHWFGGHSLGEYSALVAAGVLPYEVAIQVVHQRGKLMQTAVPAETGAMAAVLMDACPYDEIQSIAHFHNTEIANYNSKKQLVLSGLKPDLDATVQAIKTQFADSALRVVYLTVSAPFHSRYMRDIEAPFEAFFKQFETSICTTNLPHVLSNYTGAFYGTLTPSALIQCLAKQLSHEVKWQINMETLLHAHPTAQILEIGPNSVLRNFFKSLGTRIDAVYDEASLQKVFA
jgi:malonyl CoA-acyl carrier protein transacylase